VPPLVALFGRGLGQLDIPDLMLAPLEQRARPVVPLTLGDAVGVHQHQGVESLVQLLLQTCQSPQPVVPCLALPWP
jgi:hypothetical protein